jgi:DNA transformation protein
MKRERDQHQKNRLIPMRVSDGFKSFVLDQLDELGEVTPRSMFGGVGLYRAGVFFGILAADVLYLKVDDANRPDYERAGAKPFKPYPNRPGTMQYYAVPLDVLESAPELIAWARRAVAAGVRAVSEPPPRRPQSRRPRARAKR